MPWGYLTGDIDFNMGDRLQHVTGLYAYAQDDWRWPIMHTDDLSYPDEVSAVYADVIPAMAILYKAFYKVVPVLWNPFGWWILFCLVAQGVVATLLMDRLNVKGTLAVLCIAILVVHLPAQLFRYGHAALCAHFLFTLFFLLVVESKHRHGWLGSAIGGACIIALSLFIHGYLFAMITPMVFAWWFWYCLRGNAPLLAKLATPLLYACLAYGLMVGIGYFSKDNLLSGAGWGDYAMNVAAPFTPQRSGIIPGFDGIFESRSGEYEGLNYLGLGVILLLLYSFVRFWRQVKASVAQFWPVVLILFGLMVFAWSGRVYFLSHNLVNYEMPDLTNIFGTFRSSGRFFWPVGVALVYLPCLLVWRHHRRSIATGILLTAAVIQLVDTWPWRTFHRVPTKPEGVVFYAPEWEDEMKHYEQVFFYPGVMCNGTEYMSAMQRLWYYAARAGNSTNSTYLAREFRTCDDYMNDFGVEDFAEEKGLFFVSDAIIEGKYLSMRVPASKSVWEYEKGYIVADGAETFDSLVSLGIVRRLDPAISSEVATYSFGTGGEGVSLLGEGFSGPEPWGVWGIAQDTSLRIPLVEGATEVMIDLKIGAYLPEENSERQITLSVDGVMLGEYAFNRPTAIQTISVRLPEAQLRDRRVATLHIRINELAQPADYTSGPGDTRTLGVSFYEMQVKQRKPSPDAGQ
ncbi:MAG: DUF6311 domain-containing protein [Verrucomicrobiota bacterium JB022]|nr:DUF6311 domain-containing protein [Verrucomicrobiota bacterium JB022]